MSTTNTRTIIHVSLAYLTVGLYLLISNLPRTTAAPATTHPRHPLDSKIEFEKALDNFLNAYYEELTIDKRPEESANDDMVINSKRGKNVNDDELVESGGKADIYDQMQGDEPVSEAGVILSYNNGDGNMSDDVIKTRER